MKFDFERSSVLARLAPRLSPAQLVEALSTAKIVGTGGERAGAVSALAPYLAPARWKDILRSRIPSF